MQGMDENTGKLIGGEEHLRQSIRRIIGTPIGTYPLQPAFGSRVPDLIDKPMTDETILLINSSIVEALYKWEERIQSVEVTLDTENSRNGELYFNLKVVFEGQIVTLDGLNVRQIFA